MVGDSHSFALVPCITMTAEKVGMPVAGLKPWAIQVAMAQDYAQKRLLKIPIYGYLSRVSND